MTGPHVPGSGGVEVFDDGLQPERTALSWRRTGLSLTGAALVAVRIVPDVLGLWAIVPAGFGLAGALAVLVLAHLRYRAVHAALTSSNSDRVPLPSGGLPLLVTVLVMTSAVGALITMIAPFTFLR